MKTIDSIRDISNADDMFKKAKYKKIGEYNFYKNRYGSHICFDNYDKTVEVSGRGTGKWRDCANKKITMQQLVAIYQKCKELGWLDE